MFKRSPAPTFIAPVQITRPEQAEAQVLHLLFNHKGKDALDDWIKRTGEVKTPEEERAVLLEVVAGWTDMGAEDDSLLAFTEAEFGGFLDDFPMSAHEITRQYIKALGESRVKN